MKNSKNFFLLIIIMILIFSFNLIIPKDYSNAQTYQSPGRIGTPIQNGPTNPVYTQMPSAPSPDPPTISEDEDDDTGFLARIILGAAKWLLIGVSHVVSLFSNIVHFFLSEVVILSIMAPTVDQLSMLNPFHSEDSITPTPVTTIFNILKNFAYIIMVFSALMVGYEWLFGRDDNAKRLIFNIILVALIINFIYVLIKEAFLVVDAIETGIAGFTDLSNPQEKKVKIPGTFITASFYNKGNPEPVKILVELTDRIVKYQGLSSISVNSKNVTDNEEAQAKGNIRKALNEIVPILVNIIAITSVVVFDMLLIVILALLGVIYLVRYIVIIFLVGVSPIVLTLLIFPKFSGPLEKAFSSFSQGFNAWFQELVKWLIVGPILLILLILGNILFTNIVTNLQQGEKINSGDPLNDAIGLFVFFGVLIGWYLISIRVAVNLSGKVGDMTTSFSYSGLRQVGGFALNRFAKAGSPITRGIGRGASVIGGGLLKRFGGKVGFLGIPQRLGMLGEKMVGVGERWQKGPQKERELRTRLAQQRASLLSEDYLYQKDPNKKSKIIENTIDFLKENIQNPDIFKSFLDGLNPQIVEKIHTNQSLISQIASSKLSPPDKDELASHLLEKLDKETIEQIFQDQTLLSSYYDLIKTGPLSNKVFLDKVRTLEEQEVMSILDKVKDQIVDSNSSFRKIIDDPSLINIRRSLNNKVNGLIEALINKSIQQIGAAISGLDARSWQKFHQQINDIINKAGVNIEDVLIEAFKRNINDISQGLLRLPNPSASPIVQSAQILAARYPNINNFLNDIGIDPLDPNNKTIIRKLTQLGIITPPTEGPSQSP